MIVGDGDSNLFIVHRDSPSTCRELMPAGVLSGMAIGALGFELHLNSLWTEMSWVRKIEATLDR